mmetsp:Transcript_17957/g.58746  ORF Transcript_17957/g.58746 Transcript_17957/m.58746 type:complete len:236 (+) Transcript_17957:293-1000(+)
MRLALWRRGAGEGHRGRGSQTDGTTRGFHHLGAGKVRRRAGRARGSRARRGQLLPRTPSYVPSRARPPSSVCGVCWPRAMAGCAWCSRTSKKKTWRYSVGLWNASGSGRYTSSIQPTTSSHNTAGGPSTLAGSARRRARRRSPAFRAARRIGCMSRLTSLWRSARPNFVRQGTTFSWQLLPHRKRTARPQVRRDSWSSTPLRVWNQTGRPSGWPSFLAPRGEDCPRPRLRLAMLG